MMDGSWIACELIMNYVREKPRENIPCLFLFLFLVDTGLCDVFRQHSKPCFS